MKPRTISATWKITTGLPKYSNFVSELTITADLDKGETAEKAGKALTKIVRHIIETETEAAREVTWKGKEEQRKKFESGIS